QQWKNIRTLGGRCQAGDSAANVGVEDCELGDQQEQISNRMSMVVSASLWVRLSASWTPRRRVGPYVCRLPLASFRKSTCSIRTLIALAVVTPRLYSHCSFAWLKMPSIMPKISNCRSSA